MNNEYFNIIFISIKQISLLKTNNFRGKTYHRHQSLFILPYHNKKDYRLVKRK
jgi:hypothetical protein